MNKIQVIHKLQAKRYYISKQHIHISEVARLLQNGNNVGVTKSMSIFQTWKVNQCKSTRNGDMI